VLEQLRLPLPATDETELAGIKKAPFRASAVAARAIQELAFRGSFAQASCVYEPIKASNAVIGRAMVHPSA